jgi:hypothetical protein
MRWVLSGGCLCVLVLGCPRVGAAEWHITPTVGLTFAANTSLIDPDHGTEKVHTHLGGTVSFLGGGVLGVEGLVVITPGFFKGPGSVDPVTNSARKLIKGSRSFVLMGNLMLTAPRRWTEYNLRPFVSGGVGLLQASYEETTEGIIPVSVKLAGFNIGGGAIGFFSPRTGVRFDLRYYSNLYGQSPREGLLLTSDKIHLRYMTASVGLVLRR